MKHRLAIFGAIALLALAGVAAAVGWRLALKDERTQLVLGDQYGVVTSGTRLGVRIGDPWRKADATLRSQFEPEYVLWQAGETHGAGGGFTFPGGPVLTGKAEVSYRDRSWRNGVVTLGLSDGRVVSIAWHYPGPFYIDL